jgi:hypothetical protein
LYYYSVPELFRTLITTSDIIWPVSDIARPFKFICYFFLSFCAPTVGKKMFVRRYILIRLKYERSYRVKFDLE